MASKEVNEALYEDQDGHIYQRFAPHTCIMVCGATTTGKTYLVNKWLENAHKVFQQPPDEVVYIYEENTKNQEMIDRLTAKMNITFYEGFPLDTTKLTDGSLFKSRSSPDSHRLLVMDDDYSQAVTSKDVARFFTVFAHHHKVKITFLFIYI
jgi:septin family protein